MSALDAVQRAIVAVLNDIAPVYDGVPPRAAFPYIVISDSPVTDWSTKTEAGREIRLALNIWDDGEEAASLRALMTSVEAAIDALPRNLPGWRIANVVFLRSLISREPRAPSVGLIEYRVRIIAT
jgi:Protein of unknown function (DUF3168)